MDVNCDHERSHNTPHSRLPRFLTNLTRSRGRENTNDVEKQADLDHTARDAAQDGKDDLEELIVPSIEKYPRGYAQLSAFLASDQRLMLFRGFATIHTRLLLHLQTDIRLLEIELNDLDMMQGGNIRMHSWDVDASECQKESGRTRCDILEDLREKVSQYDDMMLKANAINALQRPTKRDYANVRSWIFNEAPLVIDEQDYIRNKEDIWALRATREGTGFEGVIGTVLRRFDYGLIRWLFRAKAVKGKTTNSSIHYFSPRRITNTANVVIAVVSVVFLVAPILALYKLSTLKSEKATYAAIGVLGVFSLLFAAMLALITRAKRHEVFAACAAYCAVLVVFIGSTSS